MSLRDLQSKARRRLTVSIPVSDPDDDLRRRAEDAQQQVYLARTLVVQPDGPISQEAVDAVVAAAHEVLTEYAGHFADVVLQAMPAAEWETLLNTWTDEDGDMPPEALSAMLAACVVADDVPEATDPAWWTTLLAGEGWSYGDREALRRAVLEVNSYRPAPSLGKG